MKKIIFVLSAVFAGAALFAEPASPIMDLELNTGDVKTIKDLARNAKVTVTAPEKLSWGEGPDGKVLQFNGDKTPIRAMLQVVPPKDFSLAKGFTLRFNFKTPADYKRNIRYQLFQFGGGADKVTGVTLFLYWRGIHCRYGERSSGATMTPASFAVQPATWYNCVVTYDTKNVIIYVNGKAISKPAPATIPDIKAKWFAIGSAAPTGSGYAFKGLISTAQIYNRALTAEEISNLE